MSRLRPFTLKPFYKPEALAKALEQLTMNWAGGPDDLLEAQLQLIGARKCPPYRACNRSCRRCDGDLLRSRRHDCRYCPHCNLWAKATCLKADCQWCRNRPKTPLPTAKPRPPLPRNWGTLRLPQSIEAAIIARCDRILAEPIPEPTPTLEPEMDEDSTFEPKVSVLDANLGGVCGPAVTERLNRVLVHVYNLYDIEKDPEFRPRRGPDRVNHLLTGIWKPSKRDHAWAEAIPVIGQASLGALRLALQLAGFKVHRVEYRDYLRPPASVPQDEWDPHDIPVVYAALKMGVDVDHPKDFNRKALLAFRLAGFKVGLGDISTGLMWENDPRIVYQTLSIPWVGEVQSERPARLPLVSLSSSAQGRQVG